MQKFTLDLEEIEVVSFETELPDDGYEIAAISGRVCVTRPTVYGTCCTP
jgi:hypothetical protein